MLTAFAGSNTGLKIFSLFFALGLWLFVNAGQKAAERAFELPVEFRRIPAGLMVTNAGTGQVEVRVMGPPALLSTLDSGRLNVALDMEGVRPGNSTFRLNPDSFNLPRGVRITRVSPSVVNVRLDPVAVRSVAITVRFSGKPSVGYKVSRAAVNPDSVKVRGPAHEVNRLIAVETVPIELDGVKGDIKREVRVTAEGQSLSFAPDRVTVSVTLEEEWITKEFNRVEITAKDSAAGYSVNPRRVNLRLSGPKRILDPLQLGPEQVYLNLKGLGPGDHTVPLTFNLPPEVKVLEQRPDRFKVNISRSVT